MYWFVVGTYKTKPECEGWYVNHQKVFWNVLNNNLKKNFSKNDTFYDQKWDIGRVKNFNNILFYDLLRNSDNNHFRNDKNKIFEDHKLFKYKYLREKMVERTKYFAKEILPSFSQIDFCRIGFVGHNAWGIIKNYLSGNADYILDEPNIKNVSSNEEYGAQGNLGFSNCEFYHLYNFTQRNAKKNINIIEEQWGKFWKV
jgi:hypothetical protein